MISVSRRVFLHGVDTAIKERIETGREAVLAQVDFLHRHLGSVASNWKHDASRVTEVDLAVASRIFEELQSRFPQDDLFSEEMDPGQGLLRRQGEFSWVLDPVDGTNNYAIGVPYCSVALALLREGRPVYGLVYDAARRRLIEGGRGYPLLDAGEERRVGDRPPGRRSFVGVHSPAEGRAVERLHPLLAHFKIRALGSSALHLAYVANGILDGMVDFNVRVWDIAASWALCEAAGAEVRCLNASLFPLESFDLHMPRLVVVAGNAKMCNRLVSLLEGEI